MKSYENSYSQCEVTLITLPNFFKRNLYSLQRQVNRKRYQTKTQHTAKTLVKRRLRLSLSKKTAEASAKFTGPFERQRGVKKIS